MKKLLSLSLFLFSTSLVAQNYLDNDPQWRQEYFFGGNGSCIENQQYVYDIDGDSVVGDYTYKKVFKHGTKTFNWMDAPPVPPGCDTSYSFYQFYSLVREEGMKIFTCTHNGQDTLLYDFDLEEGDYLPLTWNQNVEEVMVLSVDSMLVDGDYRKIFELEQVYGWPNNLIEGIGFESGFLEYFSNWEFPASLQCFAENDTTYYPEYNAPCNLSVDIPEAYPAKAIKAYPNPVADFLTIELENSGQVKKISAFNPPGQAQNLDFQKIGNSKLFIDCSGLGKGIHVIRLSFTTSADKEIKVVKR